MSEPVFLTLDEVFRIHSRSLAEHGGSEGVRDQGLVESEKKKTKADLAEIFRKRVN